MRRLVFDIESNGLLDEISRVWCIVAQDIDSLQIYKYRPDEIQQGLALLSQAKWLGGHNIVGFDLPALEKVYKWRPDPHTQLCDTVILSRLIHSDLKNEDFKSKKGVVRSLAGGHRLADWGIRLGFSKGSYGQKEDAWDAFSPEMLAYCVRDVELNVKLLKHLQSEGYSEEAFDLEMRFAAITEEMSRRGFTFNIAKAQALFDDIERQRDAITAELREEVPGKSTTMKTVAYFTVYWPDGTTEDFPTKKAADAERKVRKVRPKDFRIETGPLRVDYEPFNPGSADQVRQYLYESSGWLAPSLTDAGFVQVLHKRSPVHKEKIKTVQDLKKHLKRNFGTPEPSNEEIAEFALKYGTVTDETLQGCPHPIAKKIVRYLVMNKRLGQIGNGPKGWLRLVKPSGKIHHRNITIGCATFRNAHQNPNLGQVPSVEVGKDAEGNKIVLMGEAGGWGWECRDLFEASPGYDLVGVDLAGIEACMLAHFLFSFDGGAFVRTLQEGDVHQDNATAMSEVFGFQVLRADVKSPFYGFLYGAGLQKLGQTLARDNANAKAYHADLVQKNRRTMSETEAIKASYTAIGRKVKEGLERGIRGLGDLQAAVRSVAERGYLTPLDRRRIPIRSPHSALNSLLQGAAAICMKRWVVLTFEEVKRRKWDCHLLAVVHDEVQVESRPQYTEGFKDLCLSSIEETGRYYRLHCPLSGEAKIGKTWSSTH